MPTAAGPTIWEMKFPIRREPWQLLDELGPGTCAIATRAEPSHPVFIALRANHSRAATFPSSRFPICSSRFARTRPCTGTPTWEDVLDYCRYSANPVGRLVLYLCGYRDAGAPAAFRCDLHGAAAREFLAGRHARSREGPHLHSARSAGRARPHAKTTSWRAGSMRATFR